MAVREILLLGNPVLRRKCAPVKNFSDPAVAAVIGDLEDTLGNFRAAHGFGRGIAAPQIGASVRIIFINIPEPRALINPRIVERSKSMMTLWDDCFSFPDLLVRLRRHRSIEVRYQDGTGTRRLMKASGPVSELLQHEIDHIDGILALDRAIDPTQIVYRSEWKKLNL